MSSNRKATYKCPFCDKRFDREKLVVHVEENHETELPEGFTALRYVFNYVNRKPESYHGRCTECGGPTPWDENKGRYNRQCGKKACHDSFVKKCEDNMLRKTGHKRVSETEEGQIKMLANRKISGTYKFKNGKEKTYTGSYERKALEFMDKIMNIDPDDLLCPGPILEYTLDKVKHLYITDFYYIPYNLVIEVKDGGQNPNNRNMPEYRAKQIAKEKYIISNTDYNYLRLTDNDFSQLLAVFMDLKMQLVDNTNERVIHVNENNIIEEAMGIASYAPVRGLKDSETYMVMRPRENNVFVKPRIGLTDGNFDKIFGIDDEDKLVELSKEEVKTIKSRNKVCYKVGDVTEVTRLLQDKIGTVIEGGDSGLYKMLTGKNLLDSRQVAVQLEAVDMPLESHIISDVSKVKSYLEMYDLWEIEEEVKKIKEVIDNG